MRLYHLSYGGASGLGLSPLQVIQSGRVKSVQIIASMFLDNAIQSDFGLVQVGINAISESGTPTAAPVNFACAGISQCQQVAATDAMATINEVFPCDFAVSAGQNMVLNLAGLGQAGSNWEQVEVNVWVA